MRRGYSSSIAVLVWLVLVCSCFEPTRLQAQRAARTDPIEAAALNAILGRWGKQAKRSPAWNISGEPCSGAAVDGTGLDGNNDFNPGITCVCSFINNTVCHITMLKVYALNVVGQIPSELQNLTYLTYLNLDLNYLTGPIPSFIGQFSAMQHLSLGFNPFSGPLPKELGNLTNLNLLGISLDNFSSGLPEELGNLSKLEQLYIDSSGFSGPFPSTFSKLKKLRILRASDNDFTGKIPDYFGSLTDLEDMTDNHVIKLIRTTSGYIELAFLYSNGFGMKVKLVKITDVLNTMTRIVGDIVNGSSSLASIGNLTSLSTLILRNCKVSDNLGAVNISNLANLILLDLSFNNITGQVPRSILTLDKLEFLDFSYNQLTGSFPSWATESDLHLNLVANNFVLDSINDRTKLPSARHSLLPWFSTMYIFHSSSTLADCGSNRYMTGSDNTMYDVDPTDLGASSYYVTGETRWGVSNVGKFNQAPNGSNIIYSSNQQFQNVADSELFQTARMSASSLRYYGLGLENGNYTVVLQFAEIVYPDTQTWHSLGRRVFDIYVQGSLREKNFNIRKMAGGKSFTAVRKSYTAVVSKNFLEIHLFWAGKGTCCIPKQGHYGPMISALSVTPNFTPTVRNGVPKKKSKAGAIAGIVIGASVLGLAALFGISMLTKRRRRLARQQQELYDLIGQPDVFSYAELKLATDNFSPRNILGQGGYGPVYKGTLTDGRAIAVKQLAQSSHQGERQFVAEVATMSAVQHRNLVKLHGCCIDSNTHLLVYEYLENGSLDRALFGDSSLKLDWSARFEIILGIARGLTYLHEESSTRIVHRDIKASNVLLDTDLTPKVSDFGLAKLYDENKSHLILTFLIDHCSSGYLAPEYAMRGQLTEKADVFAFGVVALEAVSGRSNTDNSLEERNIYLLEWAWGLYEEKQPLRILDPMLEEFDTEEALRVIHVALICTQGSPHQRPLMSRVVAMLTGKAEVAEEVRKPSYVVTEWQQLRGENSSCTTSSYSGSTTLGFSRQREVDPLTQSPTITGASDEIEGR
ncbi:putative LRR receptor-like serine/threonine-protein kinase [Dichanthelium oligosanthes]|uniref:non-specific serine/threonine protein kinase n=1 Tax=Dichanthelium oligosanthes TaxID=888268 RepID=A0A1E5VQ11_9POAL|nr:putative LRR receptor-like serine/threonine-protein kinase [Dichanthelium oligosanthes]